MPRRKKRPDPDKVVQEYMSWINSNNADLLLASFKEHLAKHGLHVTFVEAK